MKIFACACCAALFNMLFRPDPPLAPECDLEAQEIQVKKEIEDIKRELQDYSNQIQARMDAKFNSKPESYNVKRMSSITFADLNPQKKKD